MRHGMKGAFVVWMSAALCAPAATRAATPPLAEGNQAGPERVIVTSPVPCQDLALRPLEINFTPAAPAHGVST